MNGGSAASKDHENCTLRRGFNQVREDDLSPNLFAMGEVARPPPFLQERGQGDRSVKTNSPARREAGGRVSQDILTGVFCVSASQGGWT